MTSHLTIETAMLLGLTAGAGVLVRRDTRWLTALWAAFLPIDHMNGVSPAVFDALRYGGAVVAIVATRPSPADDVDRSLTRLTGIILALAATRLAAGLLHPDNASVRYGLVLGAGTVASTLVVRRRALLPGVVTGYLIGLAVSASVSLMQAANLPTLIEGNTAGSRYPGLAAYTTSLTWQLTTGIIVAFYLVLTSHRTAPKRYWIGCALVVLFTLAMFTNGAQGGILGLGAAALTACIVLRRDITVRVAARAVIMVTALIIAVTVIAVSTGIEVPTITDYRSSGFQNESVRVQTIQEGIEQFRDKPLLGVSSADYKLHYSQFPHFLPVESAALTGAVGLLLAAVLLVALGGMLVSRPSRHGPSAIAGRAVLASLFVSFFTGPQGPVLGIARVLPLMTAIVYAGATLGRSRQSGEPARESDATVDLDLPTCLLA